MNDPNPYESPSAKPDHRSWTLFDYVVAGLWLAIPIAIAFARRPLMLVFEDFGVELPTATRYLLNFNSPLMLAIATVGVLLVMFVVPAGDTRRRLILVAFLAGLLVAAFCVLSILAPLLSLWQNLS